MGHADQTEDEYSLGFWAERTVGQKNKVTGLDLENVISKMITYNKKATNESSSSWLKAVISKFVLKSHRYIYIFFI